MRRLGQSQPVCLINFDHVGLIFDVLFARQLPFSVRQIAKVAKVPYRTKLILNRYFSSKTYFTGRASVSNISKAILRKSGQASFDPKNFLAKVGGEKQC